jgi:hypothetical protein
MEKSLAPSRFLDRPIRLGHGIKRESQIADALIEIGLNLLPASKIDDHEKKIDRWLMYPDGQQVGLQIKYRETGKDLLFEVHDRFFDWGDPNNKIGRDMIGQAEQYLVLLSDQKTAVMIPTEFAKTAIHVLEAGAKVRWTIKSEKSWNFWHHCNGCRLELKVQFDPCDHRRKMVAYIPPEYFIREDKAKIFNLTLPKHWR